MQAITGQFAIECFNATNYFPTPNPFDNRNGLIGITEAVYLATMRPAAYDDLLRGSSTTHWMSHQRMENLRQESRRWMRREYGAKYTGGILFGWFCERNPNYKPSRESEYLAGEADGVGARHAVMRWYNERY